MISMLTISVILFIIGFLFLLFSNDDSTSGDLIGFACIAVGYIIAYIY